MKPSSSIQTGDRDAMQNTSGQLTVGNNALTTPKYSGQAWLERPGTWTTLGVEGSWRSRSYLNSTNGDLKLTRLVSVVCVRNKSPAG
jgi:hypothetical protein